MAEFLRTTLGRTGLPVFRLGLSATYRPGGRAVLEAADQGINYFFFFGLDTQMTSALPGILARDREKFVVATGAYNYIWGHQNLRRTLEKRLRQMKTDYIDVFHFLGVLKEREFPPRLRNEMLSLREEGMVRAISISTHNRKFAGELASAGTLDAMMIRYNAAHRGAERDIFPHLSVHDPGVISFTATRWRYLLRAPRGWPKDRPRPDAGMCYRFVLSNSNVDVCLTAPRSVSELQANLAAVRRGPLCEEEMTLMRDFGDAVYRRRKWFM
jgi:aryl-alcohol dehydrogenase-like predicted oxidoreductase